MATTLTKMVYAVVVLATLQRQGQAAPLEDGTPHVYRQGRRIDADSFSKDARLGLTSGTSTNNNPGTGLFSSFNFNNVIPQFSIGSDDLLAGLKPNLGNPVNNGIGNPISGWDWNIFGASAAKPIDRLALPSLPALPSAPALSSPITFEVPTVSISLPTPSLPTLPSLPSLPAFSSTDLFPSGIPKPSLSSFPTLPTIPLPSLPSLPSFPSFPSFSLPTLPRPSNIPGVPASQTQLLVIRYPDILSFFGSAFDSITTPLSSFFSGFSNLFSGINTGTVVVGP